MKSQQITPRYRGRIAPSPTGLLHLGHACTFWRAYQRAREAGGALVFRMEDLDAPRCKDEFRQAALEDLRWLGIQWTEGPDIHAPHPSHPSHSPYTQGERFSYYREVLARLISASAVYPCRCSRRDIAQAASAPHAADNEPIYPGICRPTKSVNPDGEPPTNAPTNAPLNENHTNVTWRFRVPDGEVLTFEDAALGTQTAVCGKDFGDFVVWRRDDIPSYQLAVVADDFAMQITEVVRGRDLLLSTFRQLLLYRALQWTPPAFYHTPLILDPQTGTRLAKRSEAQSLRSLRESGASPWELLKAYV